MNLVEIHVIQSVAPNNLNRDDTGSPKDALYGGVRRARISSQAQKRAVRLYFREALTDVGLLDAEQLGLRTKRLIDRLVDELQARGHSAEEARAASRNALAAMGLGLDNKDQTQYLLFMGQQEIARLADLVAEHWETLSGVAAAAEPAEESRSKGRKRAGRAAVPADLAKAFANVLDGGKAVDLALFGRMLADRPEWAIDAAAQVAHALSTHRVDREFDFYTAVDDLQPREETGAPMMGDVEFYSACLYRYANVDLAQLLSNLQGDVELAVRGVGAFLRAFVLTLPSGKQNSFAAHNPPGFVAVVVRERSMPRNLAGAFERPVQGDPSHQRSLSGLSVERLLQTWEAMDKAYSKGTREWVALLNLTDATVAYHHEALRSTLDEVLQVAIEGATELLKAG